MLVLIEVDTISNALDDLGRKEEAIIYYSKTIEICPDYGAYHYRGL